MSTTTNYRIDADDDLKVGLNTYGADDPLTPYACVTLGDVNLFVRNPDHLTQIGVAVAAAEVELRAHLTHAANRKHDEDAHNAAASGV